MKNERNVNLYLNDMLISMDRIALYIKDLDFSSFEKNFMVVDAVIRNFEIIGEAAKKIPLEIQVEYPDVPWKKMYQLRNIVSHEYFDVDHETIWKIACTHLPENKRELIKVVSKISSDSK